MDNFTPLQTVDARNVKGRGLVFSVHRNEYEHEFKPGDLVSHQCNLFKVLTVTDRTRSKFYPGVDLVVTPNDPLPAFICNKCHQIMLWPPRIKVDGADIVGCSLCFRRWVHETFGKDLEYVDEKVKEEAP